MGHLYGYARVSTTLQDPALQVDALTAAGCARIFTDTASGKSDRRPRLDQLFEVVLAGDVIVVWRLDRLGRSLRHLVETLNDLSEQGVGFRSLTEGFDTTTAGGRLLFNIMGSLAEFERDLIVERTQAGLAAARARGRHGGRRTVMTPEKVKMAREMYDAHEYSVETIAKTIGVSRMTVYRHLNQSS